MNDSSNGERSTDWSDSAGRREVELQVARVLASSTFARSKQLSDFLRAVVENWLGGNGPLKETTLGSEVLGRGAGFDPQIDNIVRVTAGKLRARLAEYYQGPGAEDPVVIQMPAGGYSPVFSGQGLKHVQITSRAHVGRGAEFERAVESLNLIERGGARLIAVSGDPGMGKSTFCADFLSGLSGGSVWKATGHCGERLADSEPYVPIIECLDELCHGPDGAFAALTLRQQAPMWNRFVATSLAPSGNKTALATDSKERMRRELANVFQELSRRRPIVMFLDDMHWADASTCEMLSHLATRASSMRLLLLAAYRPGESSAIGHPFRPVKETWLRVEACEELPLGGLTTENIQEYFDSRFPGHRLPSELAGAVYRRTEGTPLFLADMVRYLRDERYLVSRDGPVEMTQPMSELARVVPRGAREMIEATMARLGPDELAILRCAALQGMEFDSAAVAKALHREPVDLEEKLEALTRARLVTPISENDFPSGQLSVRYRFHHVLYQNVLFDGISRLARAEQCNRLAEALAELVGPQQTRQSAELAILFELGRNFEQASVYYLKAARNASRVFAHPEALRLSEKGLAVLASVAGSRQRDERELEVWMVQGMAQMSIRGYAAPEVEYAHTRARDLCARLGEDDLLVRVLWRLHTCQVNSGNLRRALELAQEMRELAGRIGTEAAIVESLHALGTTLGFMGRLKEGRQALEEVFVHAPIENHLFDSTQYVLDPCVTSLCLLSRLRALMGTFDEALAMARQSQDLASRLGHPMSHAYSMFWVGFILNLRGDHAEAIAILTDAIEEATLNGLPQFVEWERIFRGSSLAMSGRMDEGIAEMRSSLANQFAMRNLIERPYCLTLLAEALVEAARPGEALLICDEALDIARRTEARSYEAETHRIRGEALLAMGGADQLVLAEGAFRQSISIAESSGCGALLLRTAISQFDHSGGDGEVRKRLEAVIESLPPSESLWLVRAHETSSSVRRPVCSGPE